MATTEDVMLNGTLIRNGSSYLTERDCGCWLWCGGPRVADRIQSGCAKHDSKEQTA